jgi:hypothetical protein
MVGSPIENEGDVNIFVCERTIQQLINVLYMHGITKNPLYG